MKDALFFHFVSLLVALIALPMPGSSGNPRDYVELVKSRLVIVRIPAGSFQMGTDLVIRADDHWEPCANCPARNDVERPVHRVSISEDFWMGQFPVTQRQWQEVMGNNPSNFRNAGPEAPVEQVNWKDVQAFLAKVNSIQDHWTVRLPTEAEWEYAARAESTGETYGPLNDIAWYSGNASHTTHPVGQKLPNAFGLYDMLGNVWQWCQDWFGPYFPGSAIDPQGPPTGERRVTRGGCFYCDAVHERAARRNRDLEDHLSQSIGFRVVAVLRKSTATRVPTAMDSICGATSAGCTPWRNSSAPNNRPPLLQPLKITPHSRRVPHDRRVAAVSRENSGPAAGEGVPSRPAISV